MEYNAGSYDIAVIGAGHAGCEAALAAARLGMNTILFTISLDGVANMPCNPSIGGTAKGHLVREIDALGGEMGKAADRTMIQSRMLNRGKGPAVHSLRNQIDRMAYHTLMKHTLEQQENLDMKQAEVVSLRKSGEPEAFQVVTALEAVYQVRAVILCTGTYLKGVVYVGDVSYESGPDGTHAANKLSQSLLNMGVSLRRFKTGTPARVSRRSINFAQLEPQEGDDPVTPFSFETIEPLQNKALCHIAYTNEQTHRTIRENIHRSPLYSGKIEGIGPRYCPSIEDKVVRFADKPRHQIFVEPMGLSTDEMYLQGMSSSLPEDVQVAFYRTIKGFENVRVMRTAYAIEYDCCDPLELRPTLEFKQVQGLYGAGQFNGTSGYEEAAAQGLYAAVNAVRKLRGQPPFFLDRASSYLGTLVDDLVIKGCSDPYRMMTSRSEYRLILRQDNADERLTPAGHEIGLISDERFARFLHRQAQKQAEMRRLESTVLPPGEELNALLVSRETVAVTTGARVADLIRRPQISYSDLAPFDALRPALENGVAEQVETEIKYAGYIKKQLIQVEQMRRLESRPLPVDIDYAAITGLRLEAREKLEKLRPISVGQASRVSGVSPADISVLLIYLEQRRGQEKASGGGK